MDLENEDQVMFVFNDVLEMITGFASGDTFRMKRLMCKMIENGWTVSDGMWNELIKRGRDESAGKADTPEAD